MNALPNTETVELVKHTDLQPDANQPRTYFDKEALQELADDISVRGIMEPILYFISKDNKKTILAGERRWRAAEIAGLKDVPCLHRESGTEIDRLLDQVSENLQREGLNAIEMAHFFDQMIEKHKIKAAELGEFLVKYGFKNFERSYITNIRRLLKLPKWAKIKIQKKELTAAHGKHLLPAIASKEVMKQMQAFLKKPCTTAELKEEVEDTYGQLHIDVSSCGHVKTQNSDTWEAIKFNYKKTCNGCKTCQTIKTDYQTHHYCLNETCFNEHQQAAKEKIKKAEERKAKADAKKLEEQQIERAEQQNISVAELKERDAKSSPPEPDKRAENRIEKTQQHLDEWLRKQIDTHLIEDEATRYKIILWMAAGAPGDFCANYAGPGSVDIDLDTDIEDHGIDITLQNKLDPIQMELMTCTAGINSMDRDNLRTLAHYVGVVLTGYYIVDREYLDIKSKTELIESTPTAVIESWDDGHWTKICKKGADFIKDNILNMAHMYGVPEDLQQMYNESKEQA